MVDLFFAETIGFVHWFSFMNVSISPIKQITSTTKTGNDTFPTTSTIETADFGHYRFFKCRPHFLKIWKNYDIRIFSRHIIDKNSTSLSNFFIEKISCKNLCNFFVSQFSAQKFAKNLQKFLSIRINAVNFFRFSQLLVEVKNAKIEICIIRDNSSNMAAVGLKICTKQSYSKCLRILDTRSHLGWRPFLHGNPARPFTVCRYLINSLTKTFLKSLYAIILKAHWLIIYLFLSLNSI